MLKGTTTIALEQISLKMQINIEAGKLVGRI
jgi:hypothetical protein